MQTDKKINRRNWALATTLAQKAIGTLYQYTAIPIMQDTCKFYLKDEPQPMLDENHLNQIWLAYQETKRRGALETSKVSGVLSHVYHDDTMILINHSRELPEIFAHRQGEGFLFCGLIEDGQVKLCL